MTLGYKGEGEAWGLLVEVVLDYLICSFPAVIKTITLHGSHNECSKNHHQEELTVKDLHLEQPVAVYLMII